jgi:hypothetical protein
MDSNFRFRAENGVYTTLVEADERFEEAGGAEDLYEARIEVLEIGSRLKEVEWQITNMVPTTVQDCMVQLRLLKANWDWRVVRVNEPLR